MKNEKFKPFGYLLTVDLYDCRPGVSDDVQLCYDFLEEIVIVLKMSKQSPPFIFRSDQEKYPEKAGLSGWVPLIESGIQIHTLSKKNFISIDVYSCGKFDPKNIGEYCRKYFGAAKAETNYIERGVNYNSKV